MNDQKNTIEHSATVTAYVPGGIEILKEMLQPIKQVEKSQAFRTLGKRAKNSYEVTGFGIYVSDKESVNLKISRVDGDRIYSVDLRLEALS